MPGPHGEIADKLAAHVAGLVARRGAGFDRLRFLEYWLQAELFVALDAADADLPGLSGYKPAALRELPYATSAGTSKININWCDLVLVGSGRTLWIEMKDLGRDTSLTRSNSVRFVRNNLAAVGAIDVDRTLEELRQGRDGAHPALRDRPRAHEDRQAAARLMIEHADHLGVGIAIVPSSSAQEAEDLLMASLHAGEPVVARAPTIWSSLDILVVVFSPWERSSEVLAPGGRSPSVLGG